MRNLIKITIILIITTGVASVSLHAEEGQIDISSIPVTIDAPGSYILVKDIVSDDVDENGITIATDNVTIDLGGHTLDGSNNTNFVHGIRTGSTETRKNITIRNGKVNNWKSAGVGLFGSENCRVENIIAINNGSEGIFAGLNSIVKNCTAVDNVQEGIQVDENSTVVNCIVRSSGSHGILLREGVAMGNSCLQNGNNGIYAGSNSVIKNNICNDNENSGIGGFSSLIKDNHCKGNKYGINPLSQSLVVSNSCNNNIDADTNDGCGIFVEGSGTVVRHNRVTRNNYGIRCLVSDNYFAENAAFANDTDYDIAAGSDEGSGDLANVSF